MQLVEHAAVFGLAILPGAAGAGLAGWLLPGEKRLAVILGGGLALGTGLMVFVLMALLRILPPQAAAVAAHALAGAGAIWSVAYLRGRGASWGAPGLWTAFGLSFLALVTVGAVIDFSASVWNGATHENLAVRMAMAAHMARSDWPIKDIYAPDYERLYRYAAQEWAASVMRVSGAGVFAGTLGVTTVSVLAIAGGLFAAGTLLRSYLAGLLGSAVFFMAAPANFLTLWKVPFGEATVSNAYGFATAKRTIVQGFVMAHGFGLLPGNDFTIVVALAAGAGGTFAIAALWRNAQRPWAAALVAAISLASMGAAAEQTFPVGLAAIGVAAVLGVVGRRQEGWWTGAVAAGAIALALIPAGPLRAIALWTETGARASFAFTPENFLTVPTAAMLYGESTSPFFGPPVGRGRVNLFSLISLQELGWLHLTLALGVILALKLRRPYLLPFLTAPAAAILLPGLVSDLVYPINMGRFTALAVHLGGYATGLVAAELSAVSVLERRWASKGLAIGMVGLASGAWIASVPLWPAKVYETANVHLEEDLEVARFARSLPYGKRALLLPGPLDIAGVNSDEWEGMHKFAVSFGTLFLPMGLDIWGNVKEYRPLYQRAYSSLDAEAMRRLNIEVVYTAPRLLSSEQREMIGTAVREGRLKPAFASSGGNRVMYFYEREPQ